MSSGERAKPPQTTPGTYEERNPFDISRRSQKEVASEIAQRMVAWKQARGRSYSTPGAASPPRAGQPPLGAPAQPAHASKLAERAAQAPQAAPAHDAEKPRPQRAPLFATASIQRAMPPAPSPKVSSRARSDLGAERAEAGKRDERPHVAAEPAIDAPPALPTTEITESAATLPSIEESPRGSIAAASPRAAAEAPIELERSRSLDASAPAGNAEEIEARRAKARAIQARWMAAHDFEGVPATEESQPRAAASEVPATAERNVPPPTVEEPRIAAAAPPLESLDEMSVRQGPSFDAPLAPQASADIEVEDARPAVETPGLAAIPPVEVLDELAGRKEPTFDAGRPRETAAAAALTTKQDEVPAPKSAAIASPIPPIETLDAVAGRREPTFDALPGKKQAATVGPAASEAKAPRPTRRIEMPVIQTRIEARRIEALRADPHMAVRRAKRSRVEPKAWEVMPPTAMPPNAMPARRERRSTSWAIGLGAVLLIIGITAPAAILRQGWQSGPVNQDQAAIDPISSQDHASQGSRSPDEPAATQAPPAAPQPQQAALLPSRSAAPEPGLSTATARPPVNAQSPASESDMGSADAGKQAILGPVRDRGALEEAPVSTPPAPDAAQGPLVNLASQDSARPPFRQASPMVARPFTPQQPAARPFFPVPAPSASTSPNTIGTATVPIDSTGNGASIGLKPTLIPVLKPKASAAPPQGAVSPTRARKPRPFVPQTVEQMFQQLVNTLSEGQPPNRELQPPAPSARR